MWIAAQLSDDWLRVWIHGRQEMMSLSAPSNSEIAIEDQLLNLIGPELIADEVTLVVCAGVPGAARAEVPAAPQRARLLTTQDPRIAVFAIPRLTQADPADLMQGEEATVAGFMGEYPEWDGVLCIAGACTRWVHISAGEVVSFRSFLTGEMFALLCDQSSLRDATIAGGWDPDTFDASVADAMSRPERLTASLADVRAEAFLSGIDAGSARARVLGWLIGAELAAARPYWLGQNVALIGDGEGVAHYTEALKAQGAMMQVHGADKLALRGLQEAYSKLRHS